MATTNFLDQLPPRIRAMAVQVNLTTPEAILSAPKSRFLESTRSSFKKQSLNAVVSSCTPEDVRLLKQAAAKLLAPSSVTASTLLQQPHSSKWSRITFGCEALDHCTGGGVMTRGITEFCGISATGKTQLLLQLSLCVQLPITLGGLGKGVAYVCTEDIFPSKRLLEISKAFSQRYAAQDINYMGNIYIEHVIESKDFVACVTNNLANLMRSVNIGLIVIDSVAAIFRLYTNMTARTRDMRLVANALLNYADKYECAVICVNQMTAQSNLQETPALGLAWAHLGRTRIRLSKVPKQVKLNDQLLTVRKLEILYSPETPNESAEFLITSAGVVNVPLV